jgi:hypothetical protein
MNKDIRIAVTFLDHPKTIKLQRRLGDSAVLSLLRLWFHVAQNKPDGVLLGMDVEDIEIASRWGGDQGLFASTLLDIGWLADEQGIYVVHDWAEHNPYAANASMRQDKARRAAYAKHARKVAEHTPSMLPSDSSYAPSPSPSPSPRTNILAFASGFERFWKSYPKRKAKGSAEKAFAKIKPNEQLLEAIFAGLERAKTSEIWHRDGGRYIPYPATWLNAKGWEDEDTLPPINPAEGAI